MSDKARFGFSIIDGEGDESGGIWFNIGPIVQEDGIDCVTDELCTVALRSVDRMERQFPGITAERTRNTEIIVEALNEYAEKRGLSASDIMYPR